MTDPRKFCGNPRGVKGHWNKKVDPSELITVTQDFCDKYKLVCSKLEPSMEVCSVCIDKIEKQKAEENLCCNPFGLDDHPVLKGYKLVTVTMVTNFKNFPSVKLSLNQKLCLKCKIKLYRLKRTGETSEPRERSRLAKVYTSFTKCFEFDLIFLLNLKVSRISAQKSI